MSLKLNSNDPRVRRTRQLLQQALIDLMHEKDFSDISVQDIAARAVVNRATFYAHFDDKYALLNYLMKEKFQEKLDERLPHQTTLTADNLRLLMLATCEFLEGFSGQCPPRECSSHQPPVEIMVQTYIYEMILRWARLTPAHTLQPEAMATVASWAIFGTAMQWSRSRKRPSAEALVDQVMPLLMQGLQPAVDQTGAFSA